MEDLENNREKYVLACNHLIKGKRQKAYLVLEEEPVDESDTGKVYTCLKCAKNEPQSQEEFEKMLSMYCLHCLLNRGQKI
jgi:hypothetical protein